MENEIAVAVSIYEQVFEKDDLDLLSRIVSADFIQHEGGGGGRETLGLWTSQLRESFPDLHFSIVAATADEAGDVWLHAQFTGTHEGFYEGVAPTGRKVTVNMLDRLRFRDGQIVEHWGATDFSALMAQIGATSPQGP